MWLPKRTMTRVDSPNECNFSFRTKYREKSAHFQNWTQRAILFRLDNLVLKKADSGVENSTPYFLAAKFGARYLFLLLVSCFLVSEMGTKNLPHRNVRLQ